MQEIICKRCDGKGYIQEYKHIQEGICFSCWGSGNSNFEKDHPQLIPFLNDIIKSDNSKQSEIISISQEFRTLDKLMSKAIGEQDEEGILYYDTRMNELITKIHRLRDMKD